VLDTKQSKGTEDEVRDLSDNMSKSVQCRSERGGSYKSKERKPVISGKVLHKEHFAIASKHYQKCTYRDEEPQHAHKLSGTIVFGHSWIERRQRIWTRIKLGRLMTRQLPYRRRHPDIPILSHAS
jgi:hypothetical protein